MFALSDVDVCKDIGLMIPTLSLLIDDEGTNAIVVSTIMEERRDSSTIQFILRPPPSNQEIFLTQSKDDISFDGMAPSFGKDWMPFTK